MIIVDVVTERTANLHAALADILDSHTPLPGAPRPALCRGLPPDASRRRATPGSMAGALRGAALPTMPLWPSEELRQPLGAGGKLPVTCAALRIHV